MSIIKSFLADESGATAIEYALIASLVAVALIAGATRFGNEIGTTFNSLKNKLDAVNG